MNLQRPIIFFDLETTGVDTNTARIVEFAAIKIHPNGNRETKQLLINPGIKIPKEASDVHGITNEDVDDKPLFISYAKQMNEWFRDCDLGGFNSDSYDVNVLVAEFERVGIEFPSWELNLVDVMKLYRRLFPNTLSAIYDRLFGEELIGAHGALVDIEGTERILNAILPFEMSTPAEIDEFLQEGKKRVDFAGKLYRCENNIMRYNFGKSKDTAVLHDSGFALWMLRNDFPNETKRHLRKELGLK